MYIYFVYVCCELYCGVRVLLITYVIVSFQVGQS